MKIQVFSSSFLIYFDGPNLWAILVDPADQWPAIHSFLQEKKIQLRYILLTQPTFQKAFRVNEIKQETGAKFLSFQSDLLKLRLLPREADVYNVCGIKTPHIDRFLDGLDLVELDGIPLQIKASGEGHNYVIQGARIAHES